MVLLALLITETQQPKNSVQPYLPSALTCMTPNYLFRKFILPALLDTGIVYILFPFLPYFVLYVLDPYSKCDPGELKNSVKCRPTYWIGFLTVSYFCGSIISLFVWPVGIKTIGKKTTWGVTSLLQIFAFPILAAALDNYMIVAMIIFFIIGIAHSGSFIQRGMLADILEYDEFLHYRRTEGTFTGIIEGLGKLTIVIVQIIPYTFLYISGYTRPVEGIPQEQKDSAKIYIECVFFERNS